MGRIVVGTSSWADPGFVEEWYPQGLAARDRLPYYAERFDGVEVNSTFYAVPAQPTVARWVEVTPGDFRFDVKLHRLLSRHAAGPDSLPRALREDVELTPRGRVVLTPALEEALAAEVLDAVEPLREAGRLSSFLLQLTPAFKPGAYRLEELEGLVEQLGGVAPVAIEPRHKGWADPGRLEESLGWMEDRGAVWVGVDAPKGRAPTIMPPVDAVTDDRLAYLRAHGRNARGYMTGRSVAERFAYRYKDRELKEIGRRAEAMAEEAQEVRLMFNNNRGADAPKAAERMRELLGQGVAVS